jgi:hypothetical protein
MELTHEQIFNVWFKVDSVKNGKPFFMWTKITGYDPFEKMYYFTMNAYISRENLLKLEYSMYPVEE